MSGLDYLNKLLDGAAVKWQPLADVTMSTSNVRWRDTERTYRYIDLTSVSIETKSITQTTEIDAKNAPSRAQKLVEQDDVIFATTRPSQQRYCLIDDEYSGEIASTGYCVLRAKKEKVLPKWILHCISSTEFKSYVEERQSGAAYPAISDALVKAFSIPIPCPESPEKSLAIQADIVRILDTFTAVTAELTAELTARKKQFNYYRDQLLNFDEDDVEWKTLGQVFNIFAGGDVPKTALSDIETEEFNIPILSNGTGNRSLYGWTDKAKIEKPSLTISARGTIGWTSYRDTPFYPIVRLLVLTPKIKIDLKYAYYFMKTIESEYRIPEAGIPQLTIPMIQNIGIPIPYASNPQKSLEEQGRIAAILDKFDALTNSLTEGLPKEIELRQKQYEYYRDLLLNFTNEGKTA
ncbi:restriction endonuclease subunit S [Rhizobium leguminosarum bv. viciae]|uniref:restriction endonuclease subunit S n=1 Tax=Rhizobium leguminosarum TaxID=384 RepID=UPI001441A378|nr:restriction endonuclease subunit S [Rhizobium leguminosarum]NKL02979.1 restriction endonuclease subunit S [Rhizobium leguminosarum bv. viciae]